MRGKPLRADRWKILLVLVAALFVPLLFLAWGPSQKGTAQRCPITTSFDMTFVQPLARDVNRGVTGWGRLFKRLQRMEVSEVVVQWTSLDAFDTYPRKGKTFSKSALISDLVKAAAAKQAAVWIGLHSETGFWTIADQAPEAIERYFSRRLEDLEERLPALLAAIDAPGDASGQTRNPVAGWYISEEIDDTRWRDPERRALLENYLIRTREALAAVRPDWPVMISAFANGAQPPAEYGAFLHGLADRAGVGTILFQDGVGAGKLTAGQAASYLEALKAGAGKAHLIPIVELFRIVPDGTILPAPLSRIMDQIDAVAPYASPTLAAFSIPDHMLSSSEPRATALHRDWRAMMARCAQKDR